MRDVNSLLHIILIIITRMDGQAVIAAVTSCRDVVSSVTVMHLRGAVLVYTALFRQFENVAHLLPALVFCKRALHKPTHSRRKTSQLYVQCRHYRVEGPPNTSVRPLQ